MAKPMATPLFDLVLLGFRNDLARERVRAYLRTRPEDEGGPLLLGAETALPRVVDAGLDHDAGLRRLGELRERGAHVRLMPSAAAEPEDDPPAEPMPAAGGPPRAAAVPTGRAPRLALIVLLGVAATAYLRFSRPALPLLPRSLSASDVAGAPVAGFNLAPRRLNDEAVALNAGGEFAAAADKLRAALREVPEEDAIRRNLRVVLHNWAVAEINADRPEVAVVLIEEGLSLQEDAALLGALGIARLRQGEWAAARTALERAVALGSDDPHVLMALGKVYRQHGERESAVEMFQRARERGAGGRDFEEALGRIERELDAEWDFDALRSPHFEIAFAGGERESDAAAQAVARELEDAYFQVGRKFDLYPSERVPVVLYPSEDFHDITQTPGWTGGVYDGRIKLPSRGFAGGDPVVRERTLRHEYGHVLVNQLSRGRVPVWLNEGAAIWSEETQDGEREEWAYRTLAGQELFPLSALAGPFTDLPDDRVPVAYAQSYLAVRALVARSGGHGLRELLAALGRGVRLDDAFGTVFPGTLSGFERALMRDLTSG